MFDYISVCSGIEAATVAWEKLGARPVCFSEIDAFPSAVLRHHWPRVLNIGDMTLLPALIRGGLIPAATVLVGGTPCQSYSVAGKRLGLEDPRGQLTLSWVDTLNALDDVRGEGNEAIGLWENVPGVLSDAGNAFGEFLGKLVGEDGALQPSGGKWTNAGCVFGPKRAVAWIVKDAQYFGLAQRRRRVFLVASARKGFNPSEVLFEFEGVRRDFAPSRTKEKVVAALTANGVGTCGADDNQAQAGHLIPEVFRMVAFGEYVADDTASTMQARDFKGATDLAVASVVHGTQDPITLEELALPLGRNNGQENAVFAFAENSRAEVRFENGDGSRTGCLSSGGGKAGQGVPMVLQHIYPAILATDNEKWGSNQWVDNGKAIIQGLSVRRLMPSECATLQGFPKQYCKIPWRNGEAPDGAQYKAYGNSMAVPCIFWIGKRIINLLT